MISKACSLDDGITVGLDDDKKLKTAQKVGTINTEHDETTQRTSFKLHYVSSFCVRVVSGLFSRLLIFSLPTVFDRTRQDARTRMAASTLSELLGGAMNQKCCHDLISRRQSPASCLPAFLHKMITCTRETYYGTEVITQLLPTVVVTTSKNFPAAEHEFDLAHCHTSSPH